MKRLLAVLLCLVLIGLLSFAVAIVATVLVLKRKKE